MSKQVLVGNMDVSNFCCGLAEVGNFMFEDLESCFITRLPFKPSTTLASFATVEVVGQKRERAALIALGYEPLKRFRNPGTGNVLELLTHIPKPAQVRTRKQKRSK